MNNNLKLLLTNNNKRNIMISRWKYFSDIDLISPKPRLFINSRKRFVTTFSIVVSIVFTLCTLSLILYFFIDFLFGSGMTMIYSKEETLSDFSMVMNKKLFAINLKSLEEGPVNPKIASMVPVLWKYNKYESEITEIKLEKCELDKHFSKKIYGNVFKNLGKNDFRCLSQDQGNLTLSFNKTDWSGAYIILYVKTCINTTENNNYCFPQEEIDKAMTNSSYYLSMLLDNTAIDHYNLTNPLKTSFYYKQMKLSYNARSDYYIYWKPIEYTTDRGWLFEKLSVKKSFQLDETLIQTNPTSQDEHYYYHTTFSKIQFALHYSSIDKYKRVYPKIQSVLANLSGLLQIIFQISKILVSLFSMGQYYTFFFENDSISWVNSNQTDNSEKSLPNREINKLCNNKETKIKIIKRDSKPLKKPLRVSSFQSLKWALFPKLNRNTEIISCFKRKVAQSLSAENIVKKLYQIDNKHLFKMIETSINNINIQRKKGILNEMTFIQTNQSQNNTRGNLLINCK